MGFVGGNVYKDSSQFFINSIKEATMVISTASNPILEKPIAWETANADELAMLRDLQGNILKGHGRKHTHNLFLHFTHTGEARSLLKSIAPYLTSALRQLKEAKAYREYHISGGVFIGLLLTSSGYRALGVAESSIPEDALFREGLKARQSQLSDPLVNTWDGTFQQDIHAMILIGDDNPHNVLRASTRIQNSLPNSVKLLGKEAGLVLRNENGDGIEHFGYVDGRSQPLLLVEDIQKESETSGINIWDPAFPLNQVLVRCPGGASDLSFGSYFVFRKLEQNVKGFKEREEEIAKELGLSGEDKELAGAMLVGRFEDGTPVVLQGKDGKHSPVPNNFDFRDDAGGMKCPFHGHIRKTNPRGDTVREFNVPLEEERSHIMARRGITYGERPDATFDSEGRIIAFDETKRPTSGVGLLFMAYQSDVARQFEFTQQSWGNNPDFVKSNPRTGIDPVIGQGDGASVPQLQPKTWGGSDKQEVSFHGFVTMKGGEYFFAPSLSCLKNL
jgi:Dyp-type peroxidase family